MEQVLYKLPDGWKYQKLKTLIKMHYGKALKAADRIEGEVSVYGSNGVVGSHNECLWSEPTVVIGRKGSVGEANLALAPSWTIDTAYYVEIIDHEVLDLIYFFYFADRFDVSSISQKGVKPGINRNDYLDLNFPLPPINEQKRIVEKLDALLTRIDAAIEHLHESVTLANALYASELAGVFSSGQDKWPLRELNEVAEVARGKSKHRPRNDKSLFGGEYPFIQTGDVRGSQKYITNFSATYNEKGLQQSKLWPKDTICLTIAANIGDVAILGMDACFPDSVVGISSSELETDYLYYFLTTLQQQLDSKANAAAQKNINLKILSEIKIPVPTLAEQNSIVRQINEIDRLAVKVKAEISKKVTMMQQLKSSILDSAFKGEL
jgi:type I restriction enzyme S subunit